jgi:hypothetical protein
MSEKGGWKMVTSRAAYGRSSVAHQNHVAGADRFTDREDTLLGISTFLVCVLFLVVYIVLTSALIGCIIDILHAVGLE